MRLSAAVASSLFVSGISLHSRAEGESEQPRAELNYRDRSDASGCPSDGQLRAAIAARLGYDPFQSRPEVLVLAEIERRSGNLVARVVARDPRGSVLGERALESQSDCAELGRALALAVSVAIDPLVLGREAPPSPQVVRAAEPAHSDSPRTAPAAADAVPPARSAARAASRAPDKTEQTESGWGLGALALLGLTSGSTPGFTPVVEAGVTVRFREFGLRGLVRWDLPQGEAGPSGGTVDVQRRSARVALCWTSQWVLLACAGGAAGVVQAKGSGLELNRDEAGWLFSPWLSLGGALRVTRHVRLEAQLGMEVALNDVSVELNYEKAFSTSLLIPWSGVSTIFELP